MKAYSRRALLTLAALFLFSSAAPAQPVGDDPVLRRMDGVLEDLRRLSPETTYTLEADAARFADEIWPRFMRPDALAVWNDWGERGAHRVIVTASPTITVAPFARRLGAEALLGTEMAFDSQDRVTGAFVGPNCRGEEKVRRLKAAYGQDMVLTAAYGDTSGDAEMLAMAMEAGFRVFRRKP